MTPSTHCWSCNQPIIEALSLPTIDPTKRICLRCDEAIKRKGVSAWAGMGKLLALINADTNSMEFQRKTA
jgi:hypothetical protein